MNNSVCTIQESKLIQHFYTDANSSNQSDSLLVKRVNTEHIT